LQTVVETAAFLSDARSLGLPNAERLGILNWIAANPAAGDVIEGTGCPQDYVSREKERVRVEDIG